MTSGHSEPGRLHSQRPASENHGLVVVGVDADSVAAVVEDAQFLRCMPADHTHATGVGQGIGEAFPEQDFVRLIREGNFESQSGVEEDL